MSARPTDVLYTPELRDFADMEREAEVSILLAAAVAKGDRIKELQQSHRVLERLRNEAGEEIGRTTAELRAINAELAELSEKRHD